MASHQSSPLRAIIYAFSANLGIALIKTLAAIFTGSSSMTAEAVHSFADTGNQLLLLLGLKQSRKPATEDHPLGFGKLTYFWSFMVAILLFSVGGLFSIYEGWHKLHDPQPLQYTWLAMVVLGISILLEGGSMLGCLREIGHVRGKLTLWQWLQRSRNSELLVVFGEDFAALLGLSMACICLSLAAVTGDSRFDAAGSIVIGLLLVIVAIFVGLKIKALLVGRSADPELEDAIEELIETDGGILEVFHVITLQMGPQLMLAAKIRLAPDLSIAEGCEKINALEVHLKSAFPQIGWCFIEPDLRD